MGMFKAALSVLKKVQSAKKEVGGEGGKGGGGSSAPAQAPLTFKQGENTPVTGVPSLIQTPQPASVRSFKKGGAVKKTGLAIVHKGEKVIPATERKTLRVSKRRSGVR